MLTQIGRFAFPSYNIVLGFWAVYSSFSRHGRATFGFITFSFISLLLDVVFCSLNSQEERFAQYTFALVVFVLCMFIKLLGIYTAAHFFSAIGGAYAMEQSLHGAAAYEPLNQAPDSAGSSNVSHGAGTPTSPLPQPYMQQQQQQQQQYPPQQYIQQQQQQQQPQQGGGYYPPGQPQMQMHGQMGASADLTREVDDGTL